MSTEKLSELSKPVAWEVKGILCHSEEEAQVYVGEPEPLYSQEYVCALLAELETKDKRIAELSRLLSHNIERAEEAEKRLATPVVINLPERRDNSYDWDGVSPSEAFNTCRSICGLMFRQQLRAAGFTVQEG